jgi:hypothetical protein
MTNAWQAFAAGLKTGLRHAFFRRSTIVAVALPILLFVLARIYLPSGGQDERLHNAFERKFAQTCSLSLENQFPVLNYGSGNGVNKPLITPQRDACACWTRSIFDQLSWSQRGKLNAGEKIDSEMSKALSDSFTLCRGGLETHLKLAQGTIEWASLLHNK